MGSTLAVLAVQILIVHHRIGKVIREMCIDVVCLDRVRTFKVE